MANRIQIRHGTTTPTSSNLMDYELGWDSTNKILYIGYTENNTFSCIPIGGLRTGTGTASARSVNSNSIASGNYSFAFGSAAQATGANSFAFGGAIASGLISFAVGGSVTGSNPTEASGIGAIAIGSSCFATNGYSAAIGQQCTSSGQMSFVYGNNNTASSNYCLAIGRYLLASSTNQIVLGKYNIEDTSETYAFILGWGTSSTRANLFTIGTDGNVTATSFTGNLTGTATAATQDGSGNVITSTYLPLSGGTLTGRLTVPGITINSTSGAAHLQFSRTSYNYVIVPFADGGSFNLANSVASADIYYNFTSTGCLPGTTNTYTLGSSSKKWSNVYATTFTGDVTGNVTGDVTGNASSSTYATYVRVTDTTPTSATYYYPNFTLGKTSGSDFALRASGSLRFYLTASSAACYLVIGASGTTSRIRAYNTNGKYCDLVTQGFGANRTQYFADRDGYGVVAESSRKIWVTTSATKPSNAVTNDIVLVKV